MTDTLPRAEAVAAANWWADKLADENVRHDAGAPKTSAWANAVSDTTKRSRTEEEIAAFRTALAGAIEHRIREESWRSALPDLGSYHRAIQVDYDPDPVLYEAANEAGFTLHRYEFPIKTAMWINPGSVRVRGGFGAEIVTVWPKEESQPNV